MPRWKTPRWLLGAPALVALAVAGCGAAANQPKLHRTAEKQLLSLVARARTDASEHRGSAVHAVLGEFVSDVRTLKSSGQLSGGTAGRLDRAARMTGAQAARQLHPKAAVKPAAKIQTVTQPAVPATTVPAATDTPATQTTPAAGTQSDPGQNGQGDDSSDSAWPHGSSDTSHGHGHAYGHSRWWRDAQRAAQSGGAATWAQWLKYLTGGGGD